MTYLNKVKSLQILFLKLLADKKVRTECKIRNNYDMLFKICKNIRMEEKCMRYHILREHTSSKFKVAKRYNYATRKAAVDQL